MRPVAHSNHSDFAHAANAPSHMQPKNDGLSFDFNTLPAQHNFLAPPAHDGMGAMLTGWRSADANSYNLDNNLLDNSQSLFSFSQWSQDDALLTATPDLEITDWNTAAPLLDTDLPHDIALAVSMRLESADPNNANVFKDIADNISKEFNVPVTQEQVAQQFEHDKIALNDAIAALPPAERDEFFALVRAHSMQEGVQSPKGGNTDDGAVSKDNSSPETEPAKQSSNKYSFEDGSKLFKDRKQNDEVEDPEHAGNMITVKIWRTRMRYRKLMPDPRNPDVMISWGALNSRKNDEKQIPDPQGSGKMVNPHKEVRRKRYETLVDDPQGSGEKITYKQRQYRMGKGGNRVEDTRNPGKTVLALTLKARAKREAMVDDPKNPGTLIRQHDLDKRDKNVMVPHPFIEGKMVKALAVHNIMYRKKEIEDPLDRTKTITMGQLHDRKKKQLLIPDPRDGSKLITRQTKRSRDYRQKNNEKRQALHNKAALEKGADSAA